MYALNFVRSILKFWCNENFQNEIFNYGWMRSELLKGLLDAGFR